jgi:hydroxymethylpyrimidine/phosphomethylpyrimidine kinase
MGEGAIDDTEKWTTARLSLTEPSQVPHMSYGASVKVLSTREDGYGGTFSAAITASTYMKYRCPVAAGSLLLFPN